MERIQKRSFSVEGTLAQIRSKHPEASIDLELIKNNSIGFLLKEAKMNLKYIALRAVSPPGAVHMKHGVAYKEEWLTYHWACYREDGAGFDLVSRVEDPRMDKEDNTRVMNYDVNRFDYTKEMWQDLQSCYPEGTEYYKCYFMPRKDKEIKPADKIECDFLAKGLLAMSEFNPEGLDAFVSGAKCYLDFSLEDNLNEYQATKNPYYLTRADFYRKLKIEHMSKEHIIIVGMASICLVKNYFIEKMLRDAYTEKIESL